MKNKCVVLMPASQYRIKSLHEHVDIIEGVDSKVFAGARIGCNLSLAECYKERLNKYTYQDIIISCSDKEYHEYYKWNIEHNRNIVITVIDNKLSKAPEYLSIDLDFIEIRRCSKGGGSGFGPNGYGYKWNVTKTDLDNGWLHSAFYIHFDTKVAKDNFAKWWYSDKKGKSLASKVMSGLPFSTCSAYESVAIPQIEWQNIHINQKELWDKGLYDEAVLSEMGLKWKDGVITNLLY